MLVLKRRDGQWLDILHTKSGDPLRVRTLLMPDGTINLVFEDVPRNYEINRPERKQTEPVS